MSRPESQPTSLLSIFDKMGSDGHQEVVRILYMDTDSREEAAAALLDYTGDWQTANIFLQPNETLKWLSQMTTGHEE